MSCRPNELLGGRKPIWRRRSILVRKDFSGTAFRQHSKLLDPMWPGRRYPKNAVNCCIHMKKDFANLRLRLIRGHVGIVRTQLKREPLLDRRGVLVITSISPVVDQARPSSAR